MNIIHVHKLGLYGDADTSKFYVQDDFGSLHRIDDDEHIFDGFLANLLFAASDAHDRFYC